MFARGLESGMGDERYTIRAAERGDLEAINKVVEAAVGQWDLPERVKRLSLPTYQYNLADFETFDFQVAVADDGEVIGVAASEPADRRELPADTRGLLLHGLYVLPAWQGRGVGSALLRGVEVAARQGGYDGVLVKAQSGAGAFFDSQGMQRLATEDDRQQYAYRYWRPFA